MTRLYVSGPIKNIGAEAKAREIFAAACKKLNFEGYTTVNPFDCGMIHMEDCDCHTDDRKYKCNLRADIKAMMDCDGVALLSGWRESKGCLVEVTVAEMLGIRSRDFFMWVRDSPNQKLTDSYFEGMNDESKASSG